MDNALTATGADHEATHHWWQQRLTAGANLALMLWFVISLALLPAFDYATVTVWLASPWAAVPMLLLVITTFHHFRLGLQVVIEDYQHDETRVVLLVLLTYLTIAAGALAVFSILKVAFAAGAV
jgi:succinate dehydrogenase / fumarate reductase membrane anchor subunit